MGRYSIGALLVLFTLSGSGCNPFSLVDKPSGDAQLLAAARACFDRSDFSCAATYYAQLSTTSNDTSISEQAFEALAQNGATMGAFMNSFVSGGSSGGKILTKLASYMISGSGQTRRLEIFHAYQRYSTISDTKLKSLVRFLTAAALFSEILAEGAASTTFQTSDLVTTPSTCAAASTCTAISCSATCAAPSGSTIVTGSTPTALSITTTDSEMSGSPNLLMLYGALTEIQAGLTGLGVTGGVGSTTTSFTSGVTGTITGATIITTDSTNGPRFFRRTLLNLDIGAQ